MALAAYDESGRIRATQRALVALGYLEKPDPTKARLSDVFEDIGDLLSVCQDQTELFRAMVEAYKAKRKKEREADAKNLTKEQAASDE